jgi:hypothetical protein
VETEIRGPNRNVGRINAKKWACKVPFICLFAHPKLPLFRDLGHAYDFLRWATDQDFISSVDVMPDWTPTWLREGFGFTVFDSCWGRDHPTRQILKAIHKANEQDLE